MSAPRLVGHANMSHKILLLIDLVIIAASPFVIWGLLAIIGQAWNTNLRGVLPWLRALRWVTWGSAMLLLLVALATNGRLWLVPFGGITIGASAELSFVEQWIKRRRAPDQAA
jgi:hypothetical protein